MKKEKHLRVAFRFSVSSGFFICCFCDQELDCESEKRKSSGGRAKTKTKAAKIEAMRPKKPPTAFFFFLEDFRKEYQEENPGVKAMKDIGKACGEKWKSMKYEEKVHYYDIATKKRAEFQIAMANFTKKKENGEFDKDDSDFDPDFE